MSESKNFKKEDPKVKQAKEGKSPVTGSCLCQKVSYQITGDLGIFQYCHCSRCRKFTGSAHASNLLISPEDFQWLTGEAFVSRYELPNARHFATSFCRCCGSSLPWLSQSGKAVIVPAGTLDEDPVTRPKWNIFCDSMAPWYTDPVALPHYQGLPESR